MINYRLIANEFISRMCGLTSVEETIAYLISLDISISDIRDEFLFEQEDIIRVLKDKEYYQYGREIRAKELLAFGLESFDILQHILS